MYNPFKTKKSVKRLYRSLSNNPYSYRFFEDLSTGFSFILGENDKTKDFFAFEPKGCIAETISSLDIGEVKGVIKQRIGKITVTELRNLLYKNQ